MPEADPASKEPLAPVTVHPGDPENAEAPVFLQEPWTSGAAAPWIGLFLTFAFFDQMGARSLIRGGLPHAVLGLCLAVTLAYLCLYRIPALAGYAAGDGLIALLRRTFGDTATGVILLPVLALLHLSWFGVSTYLGIDASFRGLEAIGWIEFGEGLVVSDPRPVVWGSVVFWCALFALVGMTPILVRFIFALMKIYPIFPMFALVLLFFAAFVGGRDPLSGRLPLLSPLSGTGDGIATYGILMQYFWGFAVTACLGSADWGPIQPSRRDVRMTGWVGLGVTAMTVGALTLVIVAVLAVKLPAGTDMNAVTLRLLLAKVIGDIPATCLLWTFTLGTLAFAIYSAQTFHQTCTAITTKVPGWIWFFLLTGFGSLIVFSGVPERMDRVTAVWGALGCPMIGVLAGVSLIPGSDLRGYRAQPLLLIPYGLGVFVSMMGPLRDWGGTGAEILNSPDWIVFPWTVAGYAASAISAAMITVFTRRTRG